jgi:hypothetical protein
MPTLSSGPVESGSSIDKADGQVLSELRALVETLRAENTVLVDREGKIMELIGAERPDRILHDLRNILNERELLRALTNIEG